MAKFGWKEAAELIAVVAIVVSLGAVVYELRQTQSALISSTYQARAIDAIGESNIIADSEFLLPVLVATNHGGDAAAMAELSEVDRGRLFHWLRARMIDWDNEYYQYQNGYLDEDFFQTTTKPAVRIFAPRWRAMGLAESRKGFSDFIDELLAESSQ